MSHGERVTTAAEIGVLSGVTLSVAAGEKSHLVTTGNHDGDLLVVECPSGVTLAFVPAAQVGYVLATATAPVEEVHPDSDLAVVASTDLHGIRVVHPEHGPGTVQSHSPDADGDLYVAFDKGVTGYVDPRDLQREDGA